MKVFKNSRVIRSVGYLEIFFTLHYYSKLFGLTFSVLVKVPEIYGCYTLLKV